MQSNPRCTRSAGPLPLLPPPLTPSPSSVGHQLLRLADDLLLSHKACTQGLRVPTQVRAREEARAEAIITMGKTELQTHNADFELVQWMLDIVA